MSGCRPVRLCRERDRSPELLRDAGLPAEDIEHNIPDAEIPALRSGKLGGKDGTLEVKKGQHGTKDTK